MKLTEILHSLQTEFGDQVFDTTILRFNRGRVRIDPRNIVDITRSILIKYHLRFIIASGYDSKEGIEIMYHFMNDKQGYILNVNVVLDRFNTRIESITPLTEGANWIERELMEILGIEFINHPKPEKLFSSGNWEEGIYPYRREIKK